MLAKDKESMLEAAGSIYMANADDLVRRKCLAREEAERHERTLLRDIKLLKEQNAVLEDKATDWENKATALEEEVRILKEKLALINQI